MSTSPPSRTLVSTVPDGPCLSPQVCTGKLSLTITLVMGTYCTLLLLTSLILTLTMHHLRKQCNEYDMIRKVASLIVVAPVLFMVCVAVIGPEDDALGRRIQILLSILITGVLFWMPIAQPVRAFLVDHEVSYGTPTAQLLYG